MDRIKALLLDVNGTLFDAKAAKPAFTKLGLDEGLVELWFARVLRDAFATQAAGLFRPFKDIGGYHLDVLLRAAGRDDDRPTGAEAMAEVVAAWASAGLHPDVPAALAAAAASGLQVAVLTNGSAEAVAKPLLAAAGLAHLVQPLLDINAPQVWKPFGGSYAYAVQEQLGLTEQQVLMVAAHPWDIVGAMKAGLRGCFVQRDAAESWPPYLPPPDGVVKSFTGLVQLLGLGQQPPSDQSC